VSRVEEAVGASGETESEGGSAGLAEAAGVGLIVAMEGSKQ